MDGLKQKLNSWIESENGKVISIDVIEKQVRLWNYKISNYERRLRESPNVAKVFKNGAIVGYYWKPNALTAPQAPRNFQSVSNPIARAFLEKWMKKDESLKIKQGTLI